ncbi:hypothetical protein TNCV_3842201 [Trichonephila clavipes]|nr:hypothetical protein TNCV_3842201 [Trichonephila clavipes]
MEVYKSPCHFDTGGMSLSQQLTFIFIQINCDPHERSDPTMDIVHRRVFFIVRGVRTLSEGRKGKWCAFNLAAFRIGKTPAYPQERIHGLFWKITNSHLGIPVNLYIKLDKSCREMFD